MARTKGDQRGDVIWRDSDRHVRITPRLGCGARAQPLNPPRGLSRAASYTRLLDELGATSPAMKASTAG